MYGIKKGNISGSAASVYIKSDMTGDMIQKTTTTLKMLLKYHY